MNSSFKKLFLDPEFCEAGEASDRLKKHLVKKHDEAITELNVTFGRQILQMEKEGHAQDQKIIQLEVENRELRQKLRIASMNTDEAKANLLIMQVLEKDLRRRARFGRANERHLF